VVAMGLFNKSTGGTDNIRIGAWLGVLLLFLIFPVLVTKTYYVHLMVLALMWVVLAQSWNLLGGFAGQVSFGHAAFFGTGAYVTGMLTKHFALSPLWGFLACIPVVLILAVFIGYICFRLRGPYFTLSVLALSEILRVITNNLRTLTGGAEGILVIPIFKGKIPYYYMVLAIAVLATLTVHWLMRSKWGYYFLAIREDQEAAEAIGVNTTRYKLYALLVSAAFTGLAGAFYMNFMGYIEPKIVFSIVNISIMMVLVVMLGGVATLSGPVVGAVLMVVISELFRRFVGEGHLVLFGLLVLAIIIFMPNGIIGEAGRLRKFTNRINRPPQQPLERRA
jgi:branched-chain amino acid transport system permease protein